MNISIGWQRVIELLPTLNQPQLVGVLLEFPEKGESDQQEYTAMVDFLTVVLALQGLRIEQTSTGEVTIMPVPAGYLGHDFYLYPNGEGINYFYVFTTESSREVLLCLSDAVCPDEEKLSGWIVVMVSQIGGVNIGVIFLDQDASTQYLRERL